MDTPQAPVAPQTRRGKKHRIDFDSPHEKDVNEFDRAVDLIVQDQSLPAHLKTAIGFMLEMKEQMNAVMARNQALLEENRKVNEKNSELQKEICSLRSQIDVLKNALSRKQ